MMKKIVIKILILVVLLQVLMFNMCGCGSDSKKQSNFNSEQSEELDGLDNENEDVNEEVLEISENFFLTQINDIYTNEEDYLGRKLKYQGILETMDYEEDGQIINIIYVFRRSPGCCGNDGTAGFEVLWDGELPSQDSWVEIEGTLITFEDKQGNEFLQLKLDSLKELEERGKEFVVQ